MRDSGDIFLAFLLIILGSCLLLTLLGPGRGVRPISLLAGGAPLLLRGVSVPEEHPDPVFLGNFKGLASLFSLLLTRDPGPVVTSRQGGPCLSPLSRSPSWRDEPRWASGIGMRCCCASWRSAWKAQPL